jgi:DNA-binding MarR family transcriptional regulator
MTKNHFYWGDFFYMHKIVDKSTKYTYNKDVDKSTKGELMEDRFETFTTQIAKISRNIRKIKTNEVSQFGLKSPNVSCLYYLFKSENGLTSKELTDKCDEDKASISRSLEYLESIGYITCLTDSAKKYRTPYVLTEKGFAVGQNIALKIDNILDLASKGLTEEGRQDFYKNLIIISNNLQSICDKYEGE